MFIARVVGDVVATHRHAELAGRKLLLVRRLTLAGEEEGTEVVALDVIGVGVGERVLVVQEGGAARSLATTTRAQQDVGNAEVFARSATLHPTHRPTSARSTRPAGRAATAPGCRPTNMGKSPTRVGSGRACRAGYRLRQK